MSKMIALFQDTSYALRTAHISEKSEGSEITPTKSFVFSNCLGIVLLCYPSLERICASIVIVFQQKLSIIILCCNRNEKHKQYAKYWQPCYIYLLETEC